jgi:hypothetical protein
MRRADIAALVSSHDRGETVPNDVVGAPVLLSRLVAEGKTDGVIAFGWKRLHGHGYFVLLAGYEGGSVSSWFGVVVVNTRWVLPPVTGRQDAHDPTIEERNRLQMSHPTKKSVSRLGVRAGNLQPSKLSPVPEACSSLIFIHIH